LLDFKIPEVGENIETGNVISVIVSVGDTVKKDQDLLELETDKASFPVPSPCDGVIKEILIKEGDEVKIGQVIMKIEETAGSPPPEEPPSKTEDEATTTDKVKNAEQKPTIVLQPPSPTPVVPIARGSQKEIPAAPSVRRFAREIGIDIVQISGSGPGGRISIDDVKAFSKQLNSGLPVAGGIIQKPLPDFSKWGEIERQPMSKICQVTAEHLSHCWQTIPHVSQFGKADITELEKLRKSHSTPEQKLTVTPFLLKVMASAFNEFPQFNASIDMATNEIIYKKYINIGVAVDTENGLLVPVLRDVDKKNIFEINQEIQELADKARNRKVSLDDLKGGSMTLTNLGSIGGTAFTPIVNWPEVAILGVSRGGWEPVYEDNQFVPRFMLPLSLSYDHRLINGADGARYIKWVCEAIEQPFMMELKS